MNIQAYIQSGILDLYVTDLLSPAEQREVQRIAQTYPEVQAEINAIEAGLEQYAKANARAPRTTVKTELLTKIQAMQANTGLENASIAAPVSASVPAPSIVKLPFYRSRFAAAASIALLVLSGVSNLFLYQNWQTAKARTATLLAEKTQLAELQTSEAVYHQEQLAALTHPNLSC
jgi:hypothetical protein